MNVPQPVRLIVLHHPPPFSDVPTFTTRCLHACNNERDPSSERWNCGVGEKVPVILPQWWLPRHLEIFYMPQIYHMGPMASLPLRRKACWGFFRPEKSWRLWPGLNPRTRVLKGSTLPPDHRSRYSSHIQLFLQNEPAWYQNSSGTSSYHIQSNYVEQSPWEGIRSAARLYLMLFSKVCSDRFLQIAYWWSAFLQLKVDAKSTVVCGAPHVDPPFWLRGACILEDWWYKMVWI